MRPTFMGFETATRGLMTNQKALDIVGHNVSNIGVTGYTRQRVDLVSLNVNMRYTRYNQNTTSLAGQGANAYGVSQLRDQFLDKRFREEYADVGYYSVTSSVLEDLAASLDEISPSTIQVAIGRFEDAWDQLLGKEANEVTGAANLRAEAQKIVQIFRQMAAKIDNVWNQQEYSLKLDVDNVNSIMERIAQLNDEISRQQFNSADPTNDLYQPLELLDQRNVLLDQLSEYMDIYYETQENGMVNVWLGSKSDENPPIIKELDFDRVLMHTDDTDPNAKVSRLYWNKSGNELNAQSGVLRGALDMLNGRGLDADLNRGETYTQGILYYKDKIDQFASTFVKEFNTVIEEADPATGQPYATPRYKSLFTFAVDGERNAATIELSEDWENDASYLIENVLEKISTEGGKNDNNYAARALQLFKNSLDFGEFNGTIYDYIQFYSVTKLDNDKAFSDSRLEAVTTISDNLLNQIQQISGVSMEEEGVDMMMYKKAYDAMSRVFTTLDEMLDKLINGTGAVGR